MTTNSTSYYKGQTIQEMKDWIADNPTYIDGVLERLMMIREMKEDPYNHYYGYNTPID